GALAMQSSMLHGGAGRTRGRMTDLVQYSSPKMGGMQLVINTTFDAANTTGANKKDIDETIGVGFRYEAKDFNVYVDMIDMSGEQNPAKATVYNTDGTIKTAGVLGDDVVVSESATKIGGSYEMGALKIGVQLEQTEDLADNDYRMLSVAYKVDGNNSVYFTTGQKVDNDTVTNPSKGSTSFALAYDHKMSKSTDLYAGYGSRDDNDPASKDYTVITAGMRVKF
ncbi:MAG: porin, partial [Gammaproteobacteria bacterium]|nr:porin [Gammaproteobacteria bacterium]